MPLIPLDWDSEFFQFKIGRLEVSRLNLEEIEREVRQARDSRFALLYLLGRPENPSVLAWLGEKRCSVIDTKLSYQRELPAAVQAFASRPLHRSGNRSLLYELAYQSGTYSRFRLDTRFGEKNFKRLYRAWVDNSLAGTLADETMVYEEDEALHGFATVKYNGEEARVGLIAVAKGSRGRGLGRDLWRAVEAGAIQHGCRKITVATQAANREACVFYERLGMRQFESLDIYHFWLNPNDPV